MLRKYVLWKYVLWNESGNFKWKLWGCDIYKWIKAENKQIAERCAEKREDAATLV